MLLTLLLAGCAVKPTAQSAADQTILADLQTYLDGLRQFHTRFTQSGTDGYADGQLWLSRPGRLRVEYAPPRARLLLANHGRLLVADQTTGSTTTMPVSNTPLDILLADKLELGGAITVAALQQAPGTVQIGLVKTAAPGQGRLTLQFTTAPLTLSSVVVQDASGHSNTLSLYGLVRDDALDADLFHYRPGTTAR